jgi:predicted nucleic acid-binding protein
MTDEATTPVIYIDANAFIYFVDGEEDVASTVRPFFTLLAKRPGIATTSELTLAEVLAKAQPVARRSYFNLIVWNKFIQLQPVTREVLIDTADYRRVTRRTRTDGTKTMLGLPDAIHVVTAARAGCRMFLSADEGLAVPDGMTKLKPNETGFAKLRQELA